MTKCASRTVDLAQLGKQRPRVADQHVDGHAHRPDPIRAGGDGIEIREFEHQRGRAPRDAVAGRLTLRLAARGAQHVGTAQRQHPHRLVTDAGGHAGHQHRLSRQIQSQRDVLRGGVAAESAHHVLAGRVPDERPESPQRTALQEPAPADHPASLVDLCAPIKRRGSASGNRPAASLDYPGSAERNPAWTIGHPNNVTGTRISGSWAAVCWSG